MFLTIIVLPAIAKEKKKITLLIAGSESYKVRQAVSEVLELRTVAEDYDFYLYTNEDVNLGRVDHEIIGRSMILIVDIMYRELADYVLQNVDFRMTKVYGVRQRNGETKNIISDEKVKGYYSLASKKNIKNLLLFLLHRDGHIEVSYEEPSKLPEKGFFHPLAGGIFDTFDEYLSWYKKQELYKKDGFWVGVADYSSYANPGETGKIVSALILSLEKNNINVVAGFAYPSKPEDLFFDREGNLLVDLICGLCFKMSATATEETREKFMKLGLPVLNLIRIQRTISEWRKSPQGLSTDEITWQICVPEFNGLIEPSVLGGRVALKDERTGKEFYEPRPIMENIEFIIKRIKTWRNLQTKPNKDKKIAIIYWNHTPGKQNVGASYLNVFRSLEVILKRMRDEGYSIEGELPSEEEIKELVLKSGRNISSWTPGELDDLLKSKRVIHWPVSDYLKFYCELDPDYRKKVEEQWGKPEDSKIMVKNNDFIIPCVPLGNVILLPQPARGWGDNPMKLYHDPNIYPHHQYTAFYLWLKHEFKADAIVSLGKHGTHEWLPGKQAGLSQSCPPEVLIQDLPNLYPYIVDNIGEGIQAKRRGRGVIIDHLIPALKKAGIYQEYRELAVLIDEYNDALSRDEKLAEEKFKRIVIMVKKLGLDKDLLLEKIDEDAIEKIEHYLIELQEVNVPYGLHTFGVSPQGEALEEISQLIKDRNENTPLSEIKEKLSLCHLELDKLVAGLEGKYIVSGEGNDPLRNPDAIPTGRNFYGFDPAKVPSKDAYTLGKKQAEEMIQKYLNENSKYPDKIGLIFWATEVHRNEGVQVGVALYLLGMKPIWDKNNRVRGVEPIPGELLGRPRIDVHLQTSGLFRDSFPNVMILLDEAVRQSAQIKDVENFIAKHSQKIKEYLIEKGYNEDKAEKLSYTRVFSEAQGAYMTKLQELVPHSGIWESDEELADVFIHNVSFAYGKNLWGDQLKNVYKKSLEDVKMTMHTNSSNVYGVIDNDDVFAYLGGLSLAVKSITGKYPDVVISDQKDSDTARIEDIERTIGEELRARYLNPKWIEGMTKEDYAGAREMDKFVEYLWGWQVVTPFAVDKTKWEQVYEVYIKDKYKLKIKEFFDKASPWAMQSIEARMLEAIRKDYWDAPDKIKKNLAVKYAISVIEKGLACCHHTCNNPLLNQMVVNIISIPGLLSPELVNQFKLVVSKTVGMNIEKAVEQRKALQERLGQTTKKIQQEEEVIKGKEQEKEIQQEEEVVKGKEQEKEKKIEGYEMIEEKKEDTKLVSSGAAWTVTIIVLGFLGLLIAGWLRKR
ncbi:MAG: cobaltochelatase subunit CobN [Candidatus Hydrogenedentota bacterium]